MPELLESVVLNMIGIAGLDVRSDPSDMLNVRCTEALNVEIRPSEQGGRIAPRPGFHRTGLRFSNLISLDVASDATPGSLETAGRYYYVMLYQRDSDSTWHIEYDYVYLSATHNAAAVTFTTTGFSNFKLYRNQDRETSALQNFNLVKDAPTSGYVDTVSDATQDTGALLTDNTNFFDPTDKVGNPFFVIDPADPLDQTKTIDRMRMHVSTSGYKYLHLQCNNRQAAVFLNPSSSYLTVWPSTATLGVNDYAGLGDILWGALKSTSPGSIYYSDSSLLKWESATQPSQPAKPSTAVNPTGSWSTSVGYYYVRQTEDPDTGILSIPSTPSNLVTLTNDLSVSVTWGSTTLNSNLYRTSDGGEFFQFLVQKTGTNTGHTDDSGNDSVLSLSTVNFDVGAAGGFRFVEAHKGVLFVGYDAQNKDFGKVRWSNSAKPFNFPTDPLESPGFEFDINPNDGDQITGLQSYGPVLIVFKERNIFMISGDPPTGFRWDPITGAEGMGCLSHLTIQQTSAGLMWLSPKGICLMSDPGAKPILLSGPIREALIEGHRSERSDPSQDYGIERPEIRVTVTNKEATTKTFHVKLDLDDNADFSSVTWPATSENSTYTPNIWFNGEQATTAGKELRPGQSMQVTFVPPNATIASGTTYYARYAVKAGDSYGYWKDLANYVVPAVPKRKMWIDASKRSLAFACDYVPRNQYWLFVCTEGRSWSDVAYVMDYSGMSSDQPSLPTFTRMIQPAGAACMVYGTTFEDNSARDFMALGGPDGQILFYPWYEGSTDFDNNNPGTVEASRSVSATISSTTTITRSDGGSDWVTDNYGFKGGIVSVVQNGDVFHGYITDNTTTTLTVIWLGSKEPTNDDCEISIGGTGCILESAWFALDTGEHDAILRHLNIQSGPQRGSVTVTVRSSDQAGEVGHLFDQTVNSKTFTVQLGRGSQQNLIPVHLRGKYHQIRIIGNGTNQNWEIQQIGVRFERTGQR